MSTEEEKTGIPECLLNSKYRCDLHSYYPDNMYRVLEFLDSLDSSTVLVSASQRNTMTGELFPQQQTFFASSKKNLKKIISDAIYELGIRSSWVGQFCEFDWSDYFNIEISWSNGKKELLDYHKVS